MTAALAHLPPVTDPLRAARLTLGRPDAYPYERYLACEVLAASPRQCDRDLAYAGIERVRRDCLAQHLINHDHAAPEAEPADPMPATVAASSAAAPGGRPAEAPIPAGAALLPPRPTAPAPSCAGAFSALARWAGPLLLAVATGYLAAQASLAWHALTLCTATGC